MTTFLRVLCHKNHRTWYNALLLIQCIMNRTPNPTTKISPHELLTGNKPPPLFYGIPPDGILPGQAELDNRLIAFNRMRDKAEKRRLKARRHKNRWEPKIGDLVLVRDHKLSSMIRGKYYKMELMYKGPMVIKAMFGNYTYELENQVSRKIEGRLHKQMLKPYKGDL